MSQDNDYNDKLSEPEEIVKPSSTAMYGLVEDQEHKDNLVAANRFLESLVGKVFLVSQKQKTNLSNGKL